MFFIEAKKTSLNSFVHKDEAQLERGLKSGPDVLAFSGIHFIGTSDKSVSDFLLMLDQLPALYFS